MTLLVEVQTRTSVARLAQLTGRDNPQGALSTALSGTVTVTAGSAAVTGSGTTFSSLPAGALVVFDAQPGVGYVVASITSNTALVLATPYLGITTAGTVLSFAGINALALADAVQDAQAHFETETGVVYDDTTVTDRTTTPPTVNHCHFVGVPLAIAYLYEQRASPWPDAEVQKAWDLAMRRLAAFRANYGSAAWAAPASDSGYTPSTQRGLPDFDPARLSHLTPRDPGPSTGSGAVNDWSG